MGDDENEPVEEVEVKAEEGGVMDLNGALQGVLKKALCHDGVARGLRECVKALDRRQAHLCILAQDCDSAEYVRLVEALAQEHSISIIKVAEGKQLGEWVGLCKLDAEGKARKVVKCSCAVVRDWGEQSDAKVFLLDHLGKSA
mmetsp:Transcript_34658/g.67937  ORF Transcript_34658/g.67937 Transcript_34658/m.67937 type:complete len:143 (-) Transcript_34658:277-705(-)|eukprot:CAMPEP_0173387836 /NCGR_PEP_ID=MMETSP1356-20130122/10273_1 /TAXON_ID=77927 ORGANISM="Hemiselmis virescens, Strain PCC157" /NCGR_SAMPLE_ID=MMETSP1356 /ASSEMBLY_ACC=CAM_ASM_000847 /LENGTH=142 /DNA_ID=CAMNT_0014344575 /DNA_START=82 /DNA_END=510 /DNA_ORIENTATION=-